MLSSLPGQLLCRVEGPQSCKPYEFLDRIGPLEPLPSFLLFETTLGNLGDASKETEKARICSLPDTYLWDV